MASGKGMAPDSPKEYQPPHERNSGWDGFELDEAARHLERAEQIKANPKFMTAVAKHAEKKAREHDHMAHRIKELARGGRISPKAMKKLGGE